MGYTDEFSTDFPFAVQGDPNIKEGGNFTKFEAGVYEVNGIFGWTKKCKDDKDLPIFVPQGSGMVVRPTLRLVSEDGAVEGPPITVNRAGMACLVKAFGGDVKALPVEESSRFLLAAQEQANKMGRVRTCRVNKDGWTNLNSIEGAVPPAQTLVNDELFPVLYQWEYVGARSPKGTTPPRWEKIPAFDGKGERDIAYFTFRLAGSSDGLPTPYDGFEIDVELWNPFDGVLNSPGGPVPATKVGVKGGIPIEVKRLLKFFECFCPEMSSHRWQADPEKSDLGIDETENPLPILDRYASRGKRRALAPILFTVPKDKEKNKPRPKLDLMEFVPSIGAQVVDVTARTQAEMSQPSVLFKLVTLIEKLAGFPVFVDTPKDSNVIDTRIRGDEVAKEWAKTTLRPACEKLNLTKTGTAYVLSAMSEVELQALYNYLIPPFDVKDEDVTGAEEVGF